MAPPKGFIPWNKGKTGYLSVKSRKSISDAMKKRVRGSGHPNWKGGKTTKGNRVFIWTPDGYKRRSILKMEKKIGRKLRKNECVHHKDGNTLNDKLSNLQLMTKSKHISYHMTGNKYNRFCKKI